MAKELLSALLFAMPSPPIKINALTTVAASIC